MAHSSHFCPTSTPAHTYTHRLLHTYTHTEAAPLPPSSAPLLPHLDVVTLLDSVIDEEFHIGPELLKVFSEEREALEGEK